MISSQGLLRRTASWARCKGRARARVGALVLAPTFGDHGIENGNTGTFRRKTFWTRRTSKEMCLSQRQVNNVRKDNFYPALAQRNRESSSALRESMSTMNRISMYLGFFCKARIGTKASKQKRKILCCVCKVFDIAPLHTVDQRSSGICTLSKSFEKILASNVRSTTKRVHLTPVLIQPDEAQPVCKCRGLLRRQPDPNSVVHILDKVRSPLLRFSSAINDCVGFESPSAPRQSCSIHQRHSVVLD